MITKSISSTTAQNNFGRVLDDVTHHNTRYIVARRGIPQAIILNFDGNITPFLVGSQGNGADFRFPSFEAGFLIFDPMINRVPDQMH